ncbi:MAG: hypothetical protein AAF993_00125 [Pseudomonadota bacterium]
MTEISQRWLRIVLAGPWTLLASFVVMASLATWLPAGTAQVDNLIVPLVAYPLIWGVMFFHAILARDVIKAWVISAIITLLCAGLLVQHFMAVGSV